MARVTLRKEWMKNADEWSFLLKQLEVKENAGDIEEIEFDGDFVEITERYE